MEILTGFRIDQIVSNLTYQLSAIITNAAMSCTTAYNSAIEIIVLWLKERKLSNNPQLLKDIGDGRQTISTEYGGVSVDIIDYRDACKWSMRFKQPDITVAARTWITQAVIEKADAGVKCHVSNTYTHLVSDGSPVEITVPGFVRALSEQIGLYDVRLITSAPWKLSTQEDLVSFKELLEEDGRVLPVVLISQLNYGNNEEFPYAINPQYLASRTVGLAHIVIVPNSLSYALGEILGNRWNAYGGAVRIYLPGLNLKYGDIYQHPLRFYDKILQWEYGDSTGREAFQRYLEAYVKKYNANQAQIFVDYNLYMSVKQEKVSKEIEVAQNNELEISFMLDLYKEQNQNLKETIEVQRQQLDGSRSDWVQVVEENDDLKHQQSVLLRRVEYLQTLAYSNHGAENIEIPDSLEDIEEWCDKYLPQKLVLSGKAKRASKDSQFETPQLIYKALLVYANEYRDMRIRASGEAELREKYQTKMQELGLEDLGNPISDIRRGERENVYTFHFEGQDYKMEHHIGKSNSFDPRYCLRIYSHWDSASNRVIIGSLPGHLDLRISN